MKRNSLELLRARTGFWLLFKGNMKGISSAIQVLHSERGTFPTVAFYMFAKKERKQHWHWNVHTLEQARTWKYKSRAQIGVQGDVWLRVPSLNLCTSERCRVCDPDAEPLLQQQQQQQALAGGWTAGFLNGYRQGHLRSSPDHCGRNKKPFTEFVFTRYREKEKQVSLNQTSPWNLQGAERTSDCESCIMKKWMFLSPLGIKFGKLICTC